VSLLKFVIFLGAVLFLTSLDIDPFFLANYFESILL